MFYFVKTPWWLKRIYAGYIWDFPSSEKKIYLTFDDGPDPNATYFVLDQLRKYNALGTFFCIGSNVVAYPEIYKHILDQGHSVGNHTHHHLNGWKVNNDTYLKDVLEASRYIDSSLFRPPYGKITRFQAKHLSAAMKGAKVKVIMWDVVSGDFDEKVTVHECLQNVIFNAGQGSIIIFHDSEKAFSKLEYVLPRVLEFFTAKGYQFEAINA